jgi:hypothetical protein
MSLLPRIAGTAAVAASMLVSISGPASAAAHPTRPAPAANSSHAVFVQTDELSGNRILSYVRSPGGALTLAHTYGTGGKGGILDGAVADHLASQGSLTYDVRHSLLYAVNAGSDTVSVFAAEGARLRLQQVIRSGGSFPVSVTVHDTRVFVLNARRGGSIQGYQWRSGALVLTKKWHRGLGLDVTKAPEFVNTPGQVAFAPDGRHLVVTTKANTNAIDVFGFNRTGGLSAPTVATTDGAVPFGMTFDARGQLAVTQAATGAVVTYRLGSNGWLTQLGSALTGQAATCWVVEAGSELFASNAGSATLSGFAEKPAGALAGLGTTATGAGTIDAAASRDGRFVYVQAGVDGVVDEFARQSDGSLTALGSVATVVGQEGIAAS